MNRRLKSASSADKADAFWPFQRRESLSIAIRLEAQGNTKMSVRKNLRDKVVQNLDGFSPRFVVVETFSPLGESSNASIRVRPVMEEGFPDGTRVQCSRRMREKYDPRTRFRLHLSLRETGDGPCL